MQLALGKMDKLNHKTCRSNSTSSVQSCYSGVPLSFEKDRKIPSKTSKIFLANTLLELLKKTPKNRSCL